MIFWMWYAMITAMALHVYEMYVGIHLWESLSITWTMTCVAGTLRS